MLESLACNSRIPASGGFAVRLRPLLCSKLINWACCAVKWSPCLIDCHQSGHAFISRQTVAVLLHLTEMLFENVD